MAKADRQALEAELNANLQLLRNTDFETNKAFEGVPSEDWEDVKEQRESWRIRNREIRKILDTLPPETSQ